MRTSSRIRALARAILLDVSVGEAALWIHLPWGAHLGRALVFIHNSCRLASERGGRDRFRTVRENGGRMECRCDLNILNSFTRTLRNAGSRLQNGGHRIAKRSLAWPERSDGKSVPAMAFATMCIKTRGVFGVCVLTVRDYEAVR